MFGFIRDFLANIGFCGPGDLPRDFEGDFILSETGDFLLSIEADRRPRADKFIIYETNIMDILL